MRTKNATNIDAVCIAVAPRCPVCGSSRRGRYTNRKEQKTDIGSVDGAPVTHVVCRSTKCLDCNTRRRDKTYENRPAKRK